MDFLAPEEFGPVAVEMPAADGAIFAADEERVVLDGGGEAVFAGFGDGCFKLIAAAEIGFDNTLPERFVFFGEAFDDIERGGVAREGEGDHFIVGRVVSCRLFFDRIPNGDLSSISADRDVASAVAHGEGGDGALVFEPH